jgi:hypothetical protein
MAKAGTRRGSESSASAGRRRQGEALVAVCDPLGEGDSRGHEDVLCDRSWRRAPFARLLQPGDRRRTCLEIAELVLEQCSQRKGARISRLSSRASIAHLARGLPMAFVDGEPCVVERGRGKRPPVAQRLREGDRRHGV